MRLMIYDDTCRGRGPMLGLTHSWITGGALYKGLGRLDHIKGVRSWDEAFGWLANVDPGREIDEIQFWGHGKWGKAMVDGRAIDRHDVFRRGERHQQLRAVQRRMSGPEALWWFRTCETFGCDEGHAFAKTWVDFFECRAAGHTFIIGPWQSGLHSLSPGEEPDWDVAEGLAEGTVAEPKKAFWSKPGEPHTIHCLQGTIPDGW